MTDLIYTEKAWLILKKDDYLRMTDAGYNGSAGALLPLAVLHDQKANELPHHLYNSKIQFVNWKVDENLDRLHTLGLQDRTLLFLSFDHGELHYFHPTRFHIFYHRPLYGMDLHIPFIAASLGIPLDKVNNRLGSNTATSPATRRET